MMTKQISGIVADASLCEPLAKVDVVSVDVHGVEITRTTSDDSGRWCIPGISGEDAIVFSAHGYVGKTVAASQVPQIVRLLENLLVGYQERLWFLPGEDVPVYIHSSTSFSMVLYRHGIEKESILEEHIDDSCIQDVPNDCFVGNGLDWKETCSYTIPVKARPGIYSLMLSSADGQSFSIPMVVSTPSEKRGQGSRLLVLASTNTWQSYNAWGGRSRYVNFVSEVSNVLIRNKVVHSIRNAVGRLLPKSVHRVISAVRASLRGKRGESNSSPPGWMFERLSIRRPFPDCGLEGDDVKEPFMNHLAGGEWRILAWLERMDIDYDIVSGAELHGDGDLLSCYGAVLLSTHCEYWTWKMFEAMRKYHEEENLWILNVSGNTLYRETEIFGDGSARCISLSFRDSRADETQVLGVRFTGTDYSTCAHYEAVLPGHWVFSGVDLSGENRRFGEVSLNGNCAPKSQRYDAGRLRGDRILNGLGASGWETDKLSDTAPEGMIVVAKGQNPDGGADMVVREPDGDRGGLFSASSIVFGGCLLIDDVSSTVVKNLIKRALS